MGIPSKRARAIHLRRLVIAQYNIAAQAFVQKFAAFTGQDIVQQLESTTRPAFQF
jgi:hypothetical protein